MRARDRRVRREAVTHLRCPNCNAMRLTYAGGEDGVQCHACGYVGTGPVTFADAIKQVSDRKDAVTARDDERRRVKVS